MRWSLVLSVFIAVQSALLFVCVALPVPPLSDGLERRAPDELKESSKKYRKNAAEHPYAYHVEGLGPKGKLTNKATVKKEKLEEAERPVHGKKLLNTKGLQADHVFEVQMLKDHLKQHNIQFKSMDKKLQKQVKGILNGPKNMAFIPASINQSKGQLIKHGMAGKEIKRQNVRDDYAIKSFGTAERTAKRLDKALQKHPGYSAAVNKNPQLPQSLQDKLHKTFIDAFPHGPPGSPTSSRHSSSSPSSGSSSGSQNHSNSRQSSPLARPSTPGPSTGKRKLDSSPGKSPGGPSKNKQRTAKTRKGGKK